MCTELASRTTTSHFLIRGQHLFDRLSSFDELLHHGIQLGEVILALLDFRNELLLLLELFLPALFQLDADLVFVLDARSHEVVLGEVSVVGKLLEVLFGGDERELHVLVTAAG
jgi:hypothetical protein